MSLDDSFSTITSFSPPGPDHSATDIPTRTNSEARVSSRFLKVEILPVKMAIKRLLNVADLSQANLEEEAVHCLSIALQTMTLLSTRVLKTEYVLFSLLLNLQKSQKLENFITSKELSFDVFMNDLKDRALFSEGANLKPSNFSVGAKFSVEEFRITHGVDKILKMLALILKETKEKTNCLTLFAAIVLEGTSVAADVVIHTAKSLMSSKVLEKVINVELSKLLITPDRELDAYEIRSINAEKGNNLEPFTPNLKFDFDIHKIKTKDALLSDQTNWVIFPNLLIGGNPGYYFDEVEDMIRMKDDETLEDIGRTTFICLMGEYPNLQAFFEKSYPRMVEQRLGKEINETKFMHYPIHDFEATKLETLINLVAEIKKLILNGERVLLHCRGGHGRTGMVVIPVVAALYKISFEDAAKWVRESYGVSARGMSWRWRLPETKEQEEVAKKVVAYVHKTKRGQRGAKPL